MCIESILTTGRVVAGIGGGIFGGKPMKTFSEETVNAATRDVHRQAIRELVARDKNHPCVVIWSIANEPESDTPESRAYFEPLAAEARRLDPSRPVGFVNVMLAPADKDVVSDLFDVLMLNRYYGWYVNSGDLANAERALEAELQAWVKKHGKPIIFTEYGADTIAGLHSVTPIPMMTQRLTRSASHPKTGAASMYVTRKAVPSEPIRSMALGWSFRSCPRMCSSTADRLERSM